MTKKNRTCIHEAKIYPLDFDKDCPRVDVHMEINNNLSFYNNKQYNHDKYLI